MRRWFDVKRLSMGVGGGMYEGMQDLRILKGILFTKNHKIRMFTTSLL